MELCVAEEEDVSGNLPSWQRRRALWRSVTSAVVSSLSASFYLSTLTRLSPPHYYVVLLIFLPLILFSSFLLLLVYILNHFLSSLSFLPTSSFFPLWLFSSRRAGGTVDGDDITTLSALSASPFLKVPGCQKIMSHFVVRTITWKIGCCLQLFSHRSVKSHYFLLMFQLLQNSPSYWDTYILTI